MYSLLDLAEDAARFLEETGAIENFAQWGESRGYDPDELRNAVDSANEGTLT